MKLPRIRAIHGATGILAAGLLGLLGSGAPAWGISTLFFLWWRGIIVTQYSRSRSLLEDQFTNQAAGLLAVSVLLPLSGAAPLPEHSTIAAFLIFFACGLLSLAWMRMNSVLAAGPRTGDETRQGRSRWRQAALGGALALVGIPALLGWLVAGRDPRGAAAGLRAFFALLGDALAYILIPVVMALFWLLEPVIRWLTRTRLHEVKINASSPLGDLQQAATGPLRTVPPWLTWGALAILILLTVAALVYLFARSISRRSLDREEGVSEVRESIFTWEEAFSWTRRRKSRPRRSGDADQPSAVRRVYRQLLALGVKLGAPRAAPETPDEYLPRLIGAGIASDPARQITGLYVCARYGPKAPDAADAEQARQLFAQIRPGG